MRERERERERERSIKVGFGFGIVLNPLRTLNLEVLRFEITFDLKGVNFVL